MINKWKTYRLADIASIKTGPFGSLLHEKDYKDFGTPIITVEHLSERGIIHKNLPLVSEEDKIRLKSYLLKKGDIVFSRVGSVDRSSVISNKENGWLFSGRLLRVRPNSDIVDSGFLNQYFHQPFFKHKMRSLAVGGTMPSLNTHILANIYVKLPSLSEQREIAAILSTWDEVIKKLSELLEKKNLYKDLISNQLLFGKMRLLPYKDNLKSYKKFKWFSAPTDWKILNISDIASEISTRNIPGDNLPVLSCTKHFGLVNSLEFFGKQIFSKETSAYKIATRKNFVYATNHIEEGSIGYQDIHDIALVSPMYTVFQTDKNLIYDGYLYKLLKAKIFIKIFSANTSASVNRRGSLRWKNFAKIQIPTPTLNEQIKISHVIDLLQQEINLLKVYKKNLCVQKNALMQKFLTGQLPVNIDQRLKECVV